MNDIEQRLKRLEDVVLPVCDKPKVTKREEIVGELSRKIFNRYNGYGFSPDEMAKVALDYLEGVLEGVGTKLPFPMLNDFGRGHRGAILDVRREVFGRES